MPLCHYFLIFPRNKLSYSAELEEFYKKNPVDCFSLNLIWPEDHKLAEEGHQVTKILTDFWKQNKDKQVVMPDEYILENIDSFREVHTLCNGFIPFRGLDYYGETVIECAELPTFILVLKRLLSAGSDKYLNELLKLANEAIAQNSHLLHIGI